MGYGRGKTESGHARGHSSLAYCGILREAKADARKQRRLAERRMERKSRKKPDR
jgi:hypothetical protein